MKINKIIIMTCSVKDCKNVRRLQFSDDVSYHRIPKDRLDIFMEIIGGSGTKSSVKNKYICSEHFVASDFIIKNDKKYLTQNALPQLKLPVIPKREDNEEKRTVDADVRSTSREVPVKQIQSPSSFIMKNDEHLTKNAVPQLKLPVKPKREVKNEEIDADVRRSTSREVPVKQIQSPSSFIMKNDEHLTKNAVPQLKLPVKPKREVKNEEIDADVRRSTSREVPVKQIQSPSSSLLPKSEVQIPSRRRTVSSSSTLTASPVEIEKSPLHSAAAFEVNVKNISRNLLIESPGSTSAKSSSSDSKRKREEFVNVIHSYSENPGKIKRKYLDSKKKLVKMSKELYTAKQTIKKLKLKVSSLNDIIENLKKERMLLDD